MPLSITTNNPSIISLVSKESFFETIVKLKASPHLGNAVSIYHEMSQEEITTALSQLLINQGQYVILPSEKLHDSIVYLPEISLQKMRESKKQFFVIEQSPHTQKMIENFINYSNSQFYMPSTISNFLEQNLEKTFQFFEPMSQSVFNEFAINVDSNLEHMNHIEMPLFNEYVQDQFQYIQDQSHISDASRNTDYTPFFALFAMYLILLKTH